MSLEIGSSSGGGGSGDDGGCGSATISGKSGFLVVGQHFSRNFVERANHASWPLLSERVTSLQFLKGGT